jgi:hypothetical protein
MSTYNGVRKYKIIGEDLKKDPDQENNSQSFGDIPF